MTDNKDPKSTQQYKIKFNDSDLTIEIGKMATLASGSVTVQYGGTVVLATAVVSQEPREGTDFFPMMVDYEERWYATGKISGSRFVKRETRPSEEAVLAARMIDRPLRSMFPKKYRNDVQVIVTVLSADLEHDPDFVSIIASSMALSLCPVPFQEPIGACRIGKIDGKLVLNPKMTQTEEKSDLSLVVAGTKDAIIMLDGQAKQISEDELIKAIELGHKSIQPVIELQNKIKKDLKVTKVVYKSEKSEVENKVSKFAAKKIAKITAIIKKDKREQQLDVFRKEVLENFEGDYKQIEIQSVFRDIVENEIRKSIIKKGTRPDGRKPDEIRPIKIETGLLPRTHGSALFNRGETQVLSVTTLGAPSREQTIETMEEEATKRYMHHYVFPPFSVGDIKPLRGASRREIGHGALAEKALEPVIPSKDLFPYTIRVVSEVLTSNGSTSMASVVGSSLSLMDAGVPIKEPVAGIAIGLVQSDKKQIILSDIQGVEDFIGDMDFKVAGTKNGITAVQLDVKKDNIGLDILKQATKRARENRLFILNKVKNALLGPRKNLSPHAPKIGKIVISKDKIRDVIGPGGRMINLIIEKTDTGIDIEDDGTVIVSSDKSENVDKAILWIKDLTHVIKKGEIFKGKVTRILDFGAFVEVLPNQEGLVHISQLSDSHVKKVSDVVKVDDIVKVIVSEIDDRGRINLSMRLNSDKKNIDNLPAGGKNHKK